MKNTCWVIAAHAMLLIHDPTQNYYGQVSIVDFSSEISLSDPNNKGKSFCCEEYFLLLAF